MTATITIPVALANDGDVRADRLIEGQYIIRDGRVARVLSVMFTSTANEVMIRLRYPHAGKATGMELFYALRDDTFRAIQIDVGVGAHE